MSESASCHHRRGQSPATGDYDRATIERIKLTRELQAIGFTLTDAVDALAAHDAGGATCESD
jgi:hypothetical protein